MKILAVGDIHAGSSVSPWPDVPLPEGAEWLPSITQTWLNNRWKEMVGIANGFNPDIIVINGDVIDGDRNRELVTDRLDFQAEGAIELLGKLCEGRRTYFIRGTVYHSGEVSQHETQVARELKAVQHPKTKEYTWPFLMLDTPQGVIHFAHHIGSTSNPMYEATALMRALVTLRVELYNNYGRSAPDVSMIVRSHRHRSLSVNKGNLWAVALPSWQMKTQYTYKVSPESLPEIGFAMIEADGQFSVNVHKFSLPKPHIER